MTTVAASSAGLVEGWRVQYQQDPFTKKISAYASARQSQNTAGTLDITTIQVVCGTDGGLLVGYTGGGIFQTSATVSFKGDKEEIIDATFKMVTSGDKTRIFGASKSESADLVELFRSSKGTIAFRDEKQQGEFPAIGAIEALEAVQKTCTTV